MSAANYEPEMRSDKLANRVEELEAALKELRDYASAATEEATEKCSMLLMSNPAKCMSRHIMGNTMLQIINRVLRGEA